MGAHGHGLFAFVPQRSDENDIKPTFIAHSAAESVSAYERLPRELQQYGIWLTLKRNDLDFPRSQVALGNALVVAIG